MANPAITCTHLVKSYGTGDTRVNALRGVSLTIGVGELRLLMGPSGSGKTTLISIIAGILTQDEGQCLVNGTSLSELSESEKTAFRGKHIGFVFQAFRLIPVITVEENIAIPLLIQGTSRASALIRARALLDQFGMADKGIRYPTQLSGGQQQRVAIARALVHQPQFVVCDEPTSYLDHHTGLHIMELLQQLVKEKQVTVIVVTHDPRIVQFADHIDYLEDGQLVAHPPVS